MTWRRTALLEASLGGWSDHSVLVGPLPRPHFSISAFQHFSLSAFQLSSPRPTNLLLLAQRPVPLRRRLRLHARTKIGLGKRGWKVPTVPLGKSKTRPNYEQKIRPM